MKIEGKSETVGAHTLDTHSRAPRQREPIVPRELSAGNRAKIEIREVRMMGSGGAIRLAEGDSRRTQVTDEVRRTISETDSLVANGNYSDSGVRTALFWVYMAGVTAAVCFAIEFVIKPFALFVVLP